MDADERRSLLRQRLTEAAEQVIATEGLPALKARDLARAAGCAIGAIYNVFPDLDALILTVNLRTLALFEAAIAGSSEAPVHAANAEEAVASLVRLALAYLAFAEDHQLRWQALFQHRIGSGEVPDWYRAEQGRLFRYIEVPLARLCPSLGEVDLALRARSLFSCTHGLVSLGVDERLMPLPRVTLAREIELLVRATAQGLGGSAAGEQAFQAVDADGRIQGTEVEAHRIAALIVGGVSPKDILRDYPNLTADQIASALAYAKVNPKLGKPYPTCTAKAAPRKGRGGLGRAFAAARDEDEA